MTIGYVLVVLVCMITGKPDEDPVCQPLDYKKLAADITPATCMWEGAIAANEFYERYKDKPEKLVVVQYDCRAMKGGSGQEQEG